MRRCAMFAKTFYAQQKPTGTVLVETDGKYVKFLKTGEAYVKGGAIMIPLYDEEDMQPVGAMCASLLGRETISENQIAFPPLPL